ncbi:hypothetical protein [Methanobrevibacter millerae]|uniref:Uncharacterized protein n=1 Tax=Methanobrevibacter millerae TaxID=230361 RepID=A0A1G5XDZ0_9EURY|nr:hypothetical protein [Methanobrevibacter millerae]SDA68659.1 hypothetical protein SAMN02910315_02177 [Methanobrevibacter millerae]
MQDLNNYLMENFGKPADEISKTGYDNPVINHDFEMISFDDVAEDFNNRNKEFNGEFASADGLLIIEKENKNRIFFFEFKNIDYSKDEDRQMSIYYLHRYLELMKECEHECKVYDKINAISEYLVDRSHLSLRSKPSDSISLLYQVMKDFYGKENGEICIKKLFETEKFFFLVSKTQAQYLPFKNKSNRLNNIIKPLDFLKRFVPYHYNMVLAVNENGFDRYFYKRNEEYFN